MGEDTQCKRSTHNVTFFVTAFHIDNDRHFGYLNNYTHYWTFDSLEWNVSVNTAEHSAFRRSKCYPSTASVAMDPELPS